MAALGRTLTPGNAYWELLALRTGGRISVQSLMLLRGMAMLLSGLALQEKRPGWPGPGWSLIFIVAD
jgi:hypothetical protein